MESSAISRYIPQKSELFPGSGASCPEPDVIEIAPPLSDRMSRTKAKGKRKEGAYHQVIDVDKDEENNDVVLVEGKFEPNKKRKRSTGISLGPSSASNLDSNKVVSNKKGKEISVEPDPSPTGFNPGSNDFFDLGDYVLDDDYSAFQSHLDNIAFPAGIEAPFPFLPDFTSNIQVGPSISQLSRLDPLSTSTWFSSFEKNFAVPTQTVPFNFTQNGSSSYPHYAMNTTYPLPKDTPISESHEPIMKNQGVYSTDGMLLGQDTAIHGLGPISSSSVKSSSGKSKVVIDDDVKKRYESFKKFDTVEGHLDHYFAQQNTAMNQPPKNWAKRIQYEWKILEKDLPDTIFVRVYESRMDLLRAVIIGAEGTPYHDGLFFFDVCFTSSYPNSPPLVHYHSGGLRINPNLYDCGKVCLSLLNTWSGSQSEKWVPGTSTMLQVLVSIQGLILNTKPYFNEPAYSNSSGSPHGERASMRYNENTLILSLKTMVYTMTNPPKHFEDLVVGHFQHRVRDILMACKAYTEGVQVGCLVKGGVQDVDEGNDSCSSNLKFDVASYVKVLVAAFKKIGAKEAEEFLSLSLKESSFAPPPPPLTRLPHIYNPIPYMAPALPTLAYDKHVKSRSASKKRSRKM